MDSNCIFRLTRKSLHQIPDLSDYFKLDVASRAKERMVETSRSPSPRFNTSASQRLSRPLSKEFSSNRMSTNSKHHSLIAMRTHYAYGARSASLSSPSGRYFSSSSSRLSSADLPYRSSYESSVLARRPITPSSFYSTPSAYSTSYSSNFGAKPSFPPHYYATPRLSISNTGSSYVSKYSGTKGNSFTQNRRTSAASPPTIKHSSRFSPTVHVRTTTPVPNTTINDRLPSPTIEYPTKSPTTTPPEDSPARSSPVLAEKSVQTEQTVHGDREKEIELEKAEAMKAEFESNYSMLKAENEQLKRELELLRQQYKEKERQENESRRKLLESEAALKVWKNKCEMQKPTVVEIKEPPQSQNGLPFELIDQLDSAADRLHKLNAVKDLKRLQEEMESALLEIAHK